MCHSVKKGNIFNFSSHWDIFYVGDRIALNVGLWVSLFVFFFFLVCFGRSQWTTTWFVKNKFLKSLDLHTRIGTLAQFLWPWASCFCLAVVSLMSPSTEWGSIAPHVGTCLGTYRKRQMLWIFHNIFLQLDFFPPKGTFLFSAAHIKKATCTHFRNKLLPYYQLGVSSLLFYFF